jgi:hypothetical protein
MAMPGNNVMTKRSWSGEGLIVEALNTEEDGQRRVGKC